MAYEILMPQLSDSMEEGKLISWKVKASDAVKTGDVIAEVESDKAIMEVQSFKNGVVSELLVEEGAEVPVGTVIARIEVEGSTEKVVESREQGAEEVVRSEEVGGRSVREVSSEKVAGSNEKVETVIENEAEKSHQNEYKTTHSQSSIFNPQSASGAIASPKAKAVASRYGIDIETLQASGKLPTPAHEDDVEAVLMKRYFTPKAWRLLQTYHLSADLFRLDKKQREADIWEYIKKYNIPLPKPLSANQKAVIATVTQAAAKPVYHLYDSIDATLLHQYESKTHTVTVWLLKLFSEAMMRHETFRTTLKDDTLQVWPHASISLAMADGEALFMPVLKAVDTLSLEETAQALQALKTKVKKRKLSAEEMQGSTFGLSNLGMTGITRFDAMINGNDCAIAAIGSPKDGTIAVTLTLDHRIVNGFQAAEFMQTLKALAKDETFFKGML